MSTQCHKSNRFYPEGSDKYAKFRPAYPAEIYRQIFDHVSTAKRLAVDIATGTGQATAQLAENFDQVIAVDSSPEQLSEASSEHKNVIFKMAAAEHFVEEAGIKENSVDLITVAQALHWFDLDLFYDQCRKALKSDGCVAAWGYGLWSYSNNPSATTALHLLYEGVLGSYWSTRRRHIETRYRDLLPREGGFRAISSFSSSSSLKFNMHQCLGYLSTWSAYKTFKSQNPHAVDPLETFQNNTMKALQLKEEEHEFEIELPFFGFIAKHPIPLH